MLVSVVWWDGAHVFDRFTGIFLYPTTLWSNRPVNELEFTKGKCFWTVKIARQDCGVSSAGVDWLIAACHSNLSSTLIMEMAKWMKEPMAYSVPTKPWQNSPWSDCTSGQPSSPSSPALLSPLQTFPSTAWIRQRKANNENPNLHTISIKDAHRRLYNSGFTTDTFWSSISLFNIAHI